MSPGTHRLSGTHKRLGGFHWIWRFGAGQGSRAYEAHSGIVKSATLTRPILEDRYDYWK
jgi:hypothetical protein